MGAPMRVGGRSGEASDLLHGSSAGGSVEEAHARTSKKEEVSREGWNSSRRWGSLDMTSKREAAAPAQNEGRLLLRFPPLSTHRLP